MSVVSGPLGLCVCVGLPNFELPNFWVRKGPPSVTRGIFPAILFCSVGHVAFHGPLLVSHLCPPLLPTMSESDDVHREERRRSRDAATRSLEELQAEINETERIDEREKDRANTRRLDAEISSASAIHERQLGHADAAGLQREVAVTSRAASRADDSASAKDLEELAKEADELSLTIEQTMKLRAQAKAFRDGLDATEGLSTEFRVMSFSEQMAEKDRLILEYWDRVRKDHRDLITFVGRVFDDIVNTADYHTKLANKTHFRYDTKSDDEFVLKMLELYHGSFMYPGEKEAYRVTRRINGGPLFEYISICPELKELKESLLELYKFWKETSKFTY